MKTTPARVANDPIHRLSAATTASSATVALLMAAPQTALAYVGPGAGLTMLGALWAVLAAMLFIVGGLVLWPIRAMLRRRAAAPGATDPEQRLAREESSEDEAAANQQAGPDAEDSGGATAR